MSDSRPIGVFDSGVGGLTVAAALRRRLPRERLLYLGDTARLPYGTKSAATVRRYTQVNLEFLAHRGVKAVVVACNTASALALEGIDCRDTALPVWGVIEPGADRAAAATRNGRVGVIATESTVSSDAYGSALRRIVPGLEVWSQACPLLVPLIEEGWLDDPVTAEVARRYLEPLLAHDIDTLVLGCTHYPLIAPLLARIAGERVVLVDSAAAVSHQVATELAHRGMLAGPFDPGDPADSADPSVARDHYCVTDASQRFERIAGDFLGRGIVLELVDIGNAAADSGRHSPERS
ncbi:MAG: glutamate racemase [Acidobacteriota bacterium]|nr:glutamate racemase [Acidobacteriota bacterium]